MEGRDVERSSEAQAGTRLQLPLSRLLLQVQPLPDCLFLYLTDLLDPRRIALLRVPSGSELDGLSVASPVGQVHSVPWALAYGMGPLPADSVVSFSTATLRFRRTTTAPAQFLPEGLWVAEAAGLFARAAVVVDGVEISQTRLLTSWPR